MWMSKNFLHPASLNASYTTRKYKLQEQALHNHQHNPLHNPSRGRFAQLVAQPPAQPQACTAQGFNLRFKTVIDIVQENH